MTTLIETLSGPIWRQILLTLAHSLWQGTLLAMLLAAVLTRIAASRPQARYLLSFACLATLVISSLVTWSILDLPTSQTTSGPIAAEESSDRASMAIDTATIPSSPTAARSQTTEVTPAHIGLDFRAAAFAICTAIWLTGVSAMLGRMAWLVTGARRLAARPPLTDGRVLELVETLRRRLGIRRLITVVDSATIGPAVLGILRPVLLLPAAIVSELPADCLEAILAHELAHIRRHDYLVNLVQMLVEAALFFNPAVWWISRQIRREREACCDALAVGITGRPLTYAEALTAWLERLHAGRFSPVAAGWLGQGHRGGVLDRVRRLIIAGYRPELRGSWTALTAGLAVSLLTLSALWTGTRASVALAAEILSPAERIEELAKERDVLHPLGNSDPNTDAKATLSGTIRTTDGKPVPAVELSVQTRSEYSASTGVSLRSADFSFKVFHGTTWLSGYAAGYAPFLLGPFQTKPDETLGALEIVLEPGFTSYIRVVDGQGAPVASATVSPKLSDFNGCGLPAWKADDQGLVTAADLASLSYELEVRAPRFQTIRLAPLKFARGETVTQTLIAAEPARGFILSPTGSPIAGATIRLIAQFGLDRSQTFGIRGPVLSTTGDDGRFALDSLDDDMEYFFFVQTPDQGSQIIRNVRAGQLDLRWLVGPEFTVTGRILGDLAKLASHDGMLRIDYGQTATIQRNGGQAVNNFPLITGDAEVTAVDGKGQFQLKNLVAGKLWIGAGSRQIELTLEKPTTEVTIDLDEPAAKPTTRHVVLRFVGADPGLAPQGQISIHTTNASSKANGPLPGGTQRFDTTLRDTKIGNGTVEFDAFAPGYFDYSMKNVVGYWFGNGLVDVLAGTASLEYDIPVVAAGAIRGKILNAQGAPASTAAVNIGVEATEMPPGIARKPFTMSNIPVDESGGFFISPLPLGGVYVVMAFRGRERAFSQPVRVDAGNPSPVAKVRFSPATNVVGRILGSEGKPLAGLAVSVDFRHSLGNSSSAEVCQTNRDGRFELTELSTGIGEYWAQVTPRRDFQPAEVRLPIGGQSIVIPLAAGHTIEGRLRDAATGQPVAGAEVIARPVPGSQAGPWRYEPEQPKTGADGHFRFSNLPEGVFCIGILGWASSTATDAERTCHTGATIEIRATAPKTP